MLIVVEDEEGVRALLEELLRDRGYSVITAENGTQGLDLVEREPNLRLIITDIRMPGIDGWEFARRAMQVRSDIKVVYITGFAGERRPDDAPPGPLLRKPWRAREFFRCIEQLIGSGSGEGYGPPA